jgi:hypothetical protein
MKLIIGLITAFVTFTLVMIAGSVASAADLVTEDTAAQIKISALIVAVVAGYVIPIITSLLTHVDATAGIKQFVTALLSAVSAFLTSVTLADGSAVFSYETLLFAVLGFISAQVAYVGFWKPHALNTRIAPEFGIS